MNNARRKAIESLAERFDELKSEIELIQSEEQEYFDNMPESFQNGQKGELAQNAIDNLQEAFDYIDSCIGCLTTAIE